MEELSWSDNLVGMLSSFQKRDHLCDMNIVAEEGIAFPVHSCVAAATSSVLEAAIAVLQSKQGTALGLGNAKLEVRTNIPGSIVPSVIQCMYTGSIQVDELEWKCLETALAELGVRGPVLPKATADDCDLASSLPLLNEIEARINNEVVLVKKEDDKFGETVDVADFVQCFSAGADIEHSDQESFKDPLEINTPLTAADGGNSEETLQLETSQLKEPMLIPKTETVDVDETTPTTDVGNSEKMPQLRSLQLNKQNISKTDTKPLAANSTFNCSECGKTFKKKHFMLRHIQVVHWKFRKYKCSFCDKAFSTEDTLELHILQFHTDSDIAPVKTNENKEQCDHCGKRFSTTRFLKQHLVRAHSKRERFPCERCGKTFKEKSTMVRHIQTVHEQMRPYQCEVCGLKFKERAPLRRHKLRLHSGRKDKNSALKDSLKDRGILQICDDKPGGRIYVCGICGQRFHMFSYFEEHVLKTHKEVSPYVCNICSKGYRGKRTLRDHMSIHDGGGLHYCDQCGKRFPFRTSLFKHQLRSHGNEAFACPQCQKCFRSKDCLEAHIKFVHQDIRNYQCSYCSKMFTTKTILTVHQRTHTGVKPFECEYCGKRFSQKGSLDIHIKSFHTGERPFQCLFCPKAFVTSYKRKMHEKNHPEVENTVYVPVT